MKKLISIYILFLIATVSYSQDQPSNNVESDTSYFSLGNKKVKIIERNDSTYVKVWKEGEDEDEIHVPDSIKELDDMESYSFHDDEDWEWEFFDDGNQRFRGHWAGFEFGMNNYVDKNFVMTRTSENEFMDLNTNRSWNFNLNFAQFSIPIHPKYAGFVTGLGIEWSNYHFTNHHTIIKNNDIQQIEPYELDGDYSLNRFQTTYLTFPLLFELQFFNGSRWERMYLSGGIIGGLKLGAHTKVVYSSDGSKHKYKDRGDYYLQTFRYAFTGRVGYKLLKVYMNYYPVSLFLDERGPELYPVAMGFCITF